MKQLLPSRATFLVASFQILLLVKVCLANSSINAVNHGQNVIDWVRSKGGFVNPKLEIRPNSPDDPFSRLGVFTKERLALKEPLLEIPRSCLITAETDEDDWSSDEEKEDTGMNCETTRNLIKEMNLGNDSKFAPYTNYLRSLPHGSLTSAWSAQGKEMLTTMLYRSTKYKFPPEESTDWLEVEWKNLCKGSNDPFEENAALLVVQRSWDDLMIPLYDMVNHRNGHWLNTDEANIHHEKKNVKVRTSRVIEAGEELYTSYNMCRACGNRAQTYGSPEIFRDYGFVENFPQRWIFPKFVSFDISEDMTLKWVGEHPDRSDLSFLHQGVTALNHFNDTMLVAPGDLPLNEFNTIKDYLEALNNALLLALDVGYKSAEASCTAGDEFCKASPTRYDNLMEDNTGELENEGGLCDNKNFYAHDIVNKYKSQEEIQTAYQLITVVHNEDTKDTCFDLDDTVQQCGVYRPHYHEKIVHYTARFLRTVKRVLFVGGGDSMLLHEILKYPLLEIVVGLELDQQVTRAAFKHFGAQPHWDSDKVEWWYGDACKSLLMLPKEYFGSFDMVLVDLSETVMSFKVTDKLDIMEALSILLKPEGIMLKNELYFPTMSNIFANTIQIHYYDVPIICSQALSLGSHGTNFLHQSLTDHGIDSKNLYVGPLDVDDHREFIHDYKYIPDNLLNYCNDVDEIEEPEKQTESPGIIMIVEIERAFLATQGSKSVDAAVLETLKDEGFTILSILNEIDDVQVVALTDGYIVTQTWSEHKYCALDIHLWSSFHKQVSLRDALVVALGGHTTTTSSYRVVAGGMLGVNTWKEDEKMRGPVNTIPCNYTATQMRSSTTKVIAEDVIMEESLKLLKNGDGVTLVVCGPTETCKSHEKLSIYDKYGQIEILGSCPIVNEFVEDSAEKMFDCEIHFLKRLEKIVSDGEKIIAVIIDSLVPYETGQVLFKIFSSIKSRLELLTEAPTVMSLTGDGSEKWTRTFVDRFRKQVLRNDPVFNGEVLFKATDTSIELNVVTCDEKFITNLNEIIFAIEDRTGLVSEIRNVMGGEFNYVPGFEFSQMFKLDDYNNGAALKQWNLQKPLQQQNIFQLILKEESSLTKNQMKEAFEEVLLLAHSSDTLGGKATIHEFDSVGKGCVLFALWEDSRVTILWDGNAHVDVIVCTLAENDQLADKIKDLYIQQIPFLNVVLRDWQPRGFGKVVSFLKDVEPHTTPKWA